MPIDNAQARRFSNEIMRPVADQVVKTYRTLETFMLEVVNFEAATSAAQDADVILDGSEVDGRTPLSKLNVGEFKYRINELKTWFESDPYILTVLNRPAVNTAPPV